MVNAEIVADTHNSDRPILLLVAANWWPLAARLAAAFIDHGCQVAAVCPPGHPLRHVKGLQQIRTLRRFSSRRSLERAIDRVQPHLLVPCDDGSVAHLHDLYRLRPHLQPLIERSVGDPHGFEVMQCRQKLLQLAQELGIQVADSCEVTSAAHAARCWTAASSTALLKLDGTSGGEGVKIVRSASEAAAAFRSLRSRAELAVAIKRVLINSDPMALWSWRRWRRRPGFTLQRFIRGTPANIMVACWRGRILAELSVCTLSSQGPTGASLVVQVIENTQLSRAARLLARRLRLSGFFGLDFVLEQESGAAYLLEMNPRCTQLGHLQLPQGDLAGALCAALGWHARRRPSKPIPSDTIAFFPQAFRWGAHGALSPEVYHDVPWEHQALVQSLMQDSWPDRRWLARLYHLFRRPRSLQSVDIPPLADRPATPPVLARTVRESLG